MDKRDVRQLVDEVVRVALISPNRPDANLEPSNIVDVLGEIADALNRIATALEGGGRG